MARDDLRVGREPAGDVPNVAGQGKRIAAVFQVGEGEHAVEEHVPKMKHFGILEIDDRIAVGMAARKMVKLDFLAVEMDRQAVVIGHVGQGFGRGGGDFLVQ